MDATVGDRRATIRDWYLVAVLALAMISTFADRALLSVIVVPLSKDFHLTDFQMSLLLGLAFTTVYSLAALPLGHYADIVNRRRLLAGAIIIWSGMTVYCGFSQSYAQLFVGRMGLGLAEAALSPIAFSMIRDSFPRVQQGRAFALLNGQHLVGFGIALLAGGTLLDRATAGAFAHIAVLGTLSAWRVVLLLFGLSGIPLAILVLTLKEPKRHHAPTSTRKNGLRAALAYVLRHKRIFFPFLAALVAGGIAQGAVAAWLPAAVNRATGIRMGLIGVTLGPVQMLVVPLASFAAGWAMDRLAHRQFPDAPTRVTIAGLGTAALLALSQFYIHDIRTAMAVYIAQIFFFAVFSISIPATLALVAPSALGGKLQSFTGLAVSLIGLGSGPTIAVLVSQACFSGPRGLLNGIIVVFAVGSVASLLCYWAVGRSLLQLSRDTDQRA